MKKKKSILQLLVYYFVICITLSLFVCEINHKQECKLLAASRSTKKSRQENANISNKKRKESTRSKQDTKSSVSSATLSKRELKAEKQALKLLQKAQKLRAKGKNADAIEAYKESLFYNPTLVNAALELADLYCELNSFSEAKELYENTIRYINEAAIEVSQEQLGEYFYKLGNCYYELSDFEKASNYLVKANDMFKSSKPEPYIILAKIFMQKNNPDMVFNYMNKALKIDPYNTSLWVEMFEYAFSLKRDKELSIALEGLRHCDTMKYNYYKEKATKAKMKIMPIQLNFFTQVKDDPYSE